MIKWIKDTDAQRGEEVEDTWTMSRNVLREHWKMTDLRYEGKKRKREGEGADFKMDLAPIRWHVTRCDEDMSVDGGWDSDWGWTEETAAIEQYDGKLWEAVTTLAERHLKNVYCGRGAHDKARLATMAVRAVYVVENDVGWTSRFAMAEGCKRRGYVGHARNKLMSLDRCSAWCTTGICPHGRDCKRAHIS